MSQNQSSVDGLLVRLNIPEAIEKFREMKVERLVTLRKLSDEKLREAVPDDAKRQMLSDAIRSRGSLQSTQAHAEQPAMQSQAPRSTDADHVRSGFDNNNANLAGGGERGYGNWGGRGGDGGGGFGRGRGRGRGGYDAGPRDAAEASLPASMRLCRNYMSSEGCKYGEQCRYSHDETLRDRGAQEGGGHRGGGPMGGRAGHDVDSGDAAPAPPPRSREPLSSTYEFSEEFEIPTQRIGQLLAHRGERLRMIHSICDTCNERFSYVDEGNTTFPLCVYGHSKVSVMRAKEMILMIVGEKRKTDERHRFAYAANECEENQQMVRLLAACNTRNKGTQQHLSDATLQHIVGTFRFVQPQDVRHFFRYVSMVEKEKFNVISELVTQLQGVQAILFCWPKRVQDLVRVGHRFARYFNGVELLFVHRMQTKEERMQALEAFKKGVPNRNGIKQRLLVTTEDYAKLARKTIIPYVNLVIHFSIPRTKEFYILQSLVTGRRGTIGASFLFVTKENDENAFEQLRKEIKFVEYANQESFRETAMQLSYDTVDTPLTSENAEPLPDWRDHLNDQKVKPRTNKRH